MDKQDYYEILGVDKLTLIREKTILTYIAGVVYNIICNRLALVVMPSEVFI